MRTSRFEYQALNRYGKLVRVFEVEERALEYQRVMQEMGSPITIKRVRMVLAA